MTNRRLESWFDASVARHPGATALEVDGLRLTYRELDEIVDRVAAVLCAAAPDARRVALHAPRGTAAYAGYLAVLRIGATAVPLSAAGPPERNAAIVEAAVADAVLCAEACESEAATVARGRPLVTVPRDLRALPAAASPVARAARSPTEIAYILFTSGSTGAPKGVPIRHESISAYVSYNLDRYSLSPGCRLSQTFELTFDPSLFDLFVGWGSGATIVAPAPHELLAPATYVSSRGITHWFSVPSIVSIAMGMNALPPASMPSLRVSLFAGEQLTLDQAAAWQEAAPASVIENLYGPTELTVTVSAYRLPPARADWPTTSNRTVPIGHAYAHLEYVLLDADGRQSDLGELCVRGPQRFDGYLDERDNAGRFVEFVGEDAVVVSDPTPSMEHWYRTGDVVAEEPDSVLIHLGRTDQQLKIRGHRVEVGEIEAVLRSHPGVVDAIVLAHRTSEVDVRLHAVYAGQPAPDLAEFAGRRLPRHMVPSVFKHIDRFPLTTSGKVDRRRLTRDEFGADA